jgi:hypothetical protein
MMEMPVGFTAAELVRQDFPEPTWIVPGILPEGFAILAGQPKLGKSWLALGLSIAVATGGRALGQIPVDKGDVLLLALEDGERRLKKRLLSCLCGSVAPDNLHIRTEWPRLDQGGLSLLHAWMGEHPATRLIVIDTLAKVRPGASKGKDSRSMYDADYDVISSLKQVADAYNIALVCITHLRKAESSDPLERITGSMGVSGSADTILLLSRSRGRADASLYCTGRDFDETELALRFDPTITSWTVMGNAKEYARSQEQLQVIEILKDYGKPMSLKDISERIGKKKPVIHRLLTSLLKDNIIIQTGRGLYFYGEYGEYGEHGERGEYGEFHPSPTIFTGGENSGERANPHQHLESEAYSPYSPDHGEYVEEGLDDTAD